MQRLDCDILYYEFNRQHPVRLTIESGETIRVTSEDALSGQIRQPGDRRDKSKMPYSNPMTGPIAVVGAEPGDALAVTILGIEPSIGQCATYTGGARQLSEWLGEGCPHGAHVCPIADGAVHWSQEIVIPYRPMLGCIGTAPDWGCPTTGPAGAHGGNMDLIEVCPGNTLVLPVFVPGGHLYLGDAHAAQGHGELSANGLEMPAHTTIRVELRKGKRPPGPRIETPTHIGTVANGGPMERSIAHAYSLLILWMEAEFGWDRWLAYDLLTHVGEISVGYHGIGTVLAKVKREYLE
ncbi:MAG: acetamidase/formamidase family protein [Planctomycetota bacterium]|nr:acetamidase/formamidase family protein [Planctomycetota bacterium]